MEHLGKILKDFRTIVLDVSQKEFSAILKKESSLLKISKSTVGAYERNDRPKQIHGSAELYRVFKALFGVDLSEWQTDENIVVEDETKLTPDNVQQLKKLRAYFRNIPMFDKHIPPFNGNEKYPEPVFPVRRELCPRAEFGILVRDNSIASAVNKVEYVFCRQLLPDEKIKQEDLYLVSFDSPGGRVFKTGRVERKENEITLEEAMPDSKPFAIPEDMVRGIYEVVGHYSGKAGVDQ